MRASTLRPVPLRPRERDTWVALALAAMPAGDTLSVAVDPAHLCEQLGLTLAAIGPEARVGARAALAAFEWLAVARHGRPFSSLSPAARARWVEACSRSHLAPVRLATRLLLTLLKPAHFSRGAVKACLGYPARRPDPEDLSGVVSLPPERIVMSLRADRRVRCQVVVVGSGAGGAVVAAELAERGIEVVLVEAGRLFGHAELGRDPNDSMRAMYRDGGATIALGRPAIPIPLGATVGGTTTVNSGTCFRVPERVLDKWARAGLRTDREALSRAYEKVEARISVQPVPPELLGGSSRVIARGAEALGFAHGPLRRNIAGCRASAMCAFGCPRQAKRSMDVTYVPAALAAGATLYCGFRATGAIVEGGRAVGVRALDEGGRCLEVYADKVISACGTVAGVPFLRASGVRSPHLGRHMTIHPAAKIVAELPEIVDGWLDTPQGYSITEFAEQGLMFEGAFVPPEYTSVALPFTGAAFTRVMERYRHLAVFGFMVADEPNGRVFAGPGGRPVMTYNIGRRDLTSVGRGLDILARVFFAAGAERIWLPVAGREEQGSLAAARRAVAGRLDPWSLELLAFHPLGTARISTRARQGVIAPDLQVWGLPGLYVIDGSVFPSSLGVNPQLTIMAWATMAAERLAQEVRP